MKKSQLEILLSKLKGFKEPNLKLEQYRTPSDIAADILNLINISGDLKGRVTDLGCGIGTFTIGCGLFNLESRGIDKDKKVIKIAKENKIFIEEKLKRKIPVKFEVKDIKEVEEKTDLVVMNSPFGLRSEKGDLDFLKTAFKISDLIYSLHHQTKENESFLEKFSQRDNFKCKKLKEYEFPIPKTFYFHKKRKVFIPVGLYKFFSD